MSNSRTMQSFARNEYVEIAGAAALTKPVIEAVATSVSIGPASIVQAFVFSAGIDVVSGFVPARRAARLDPIESLRHE